MNAEADPADYALRDALEELDRLDARNNFLAYYQRMTGFTPQLHHKVTCKALQAVEDDKIDRLMVFMPRRMAKSTLCTQLFPAWIMGRHPTEKIMSAVHTQKYAAKTGKIVRNYMRHPKNPFGDVHLAEDSQAKDQWATTVGGEYNGFGLMGGSTHGNPASFLITDDLIKGRKMAMSVHMREEAWETYKADLVSSLQGRRKQIMVTTRWHQDDPAGRILPENYDGETGWFRDRETGELWFVLSIPAAAEHDNDPLKRQKGEYMWPEEFGAKFKAAQSRGGWVWSALYQQRPSPIEGLMFREEHLLRYDPKTKSIIGMQIYISSDYATKAEAGATDPDRTAHGVWGVDQDLNLYLLDGWLGKKTADIWAAEWLRLCKKWKPLMAFEEAGQIMNSVGPFLVKMMERERVFVARQQFTSSTNKEQRAQALLGMASMGKLYLPKKEGLTGDLLQFVEIFEKEILQFPGGKHDDTVDQATLMARALDRLVAGTPPKNPRNAAGESLDELHARNEADKERKRRG
jgi:predicted phage terminase large subunit-like protein